MLNQATFKAGDVVEFEHGLKWTIPVDGRYCFEGKIVKYNGTTLRPDQIIGSEPERGVEKIDRMGP